MDERGWKNWDIENVSINLLSGREITFNTLYQYPTYANLFAGVPTVTSNKSHIEEMLDSIEKYKNPYPCKPYLIHPIERPFIYNRFGNTNYYKLNPPSALPAVTCIAHFFSGPITDDSRNCSGLVVIWFQDKFAFPIDPTVKEQLIALDWDNHAANFDI